MNIYLFHRDLRYIDNTTLLKQMNEEGSITPIFIFTPTQIDPKKNDYFSNQTVQFMIESLFELSENLEKEYNYHLPFFYGENLDVLKSIHKQKKIESIGFNMDYSPFARKRDEEIKEWCLKENINFYCFEDHVLFPILDGKTFAKSTNKPYTIFTPFYKHCIKDLEVNKINDQKNFKFMNETILKKNIFLIKKDKLNNFYEKNEYIWVRGGRKNALKILKNISQFKTYEKERNTLTYSTTFLSSYINFNVVSIREIYFTMVKELGNDHGLIRELIWRDFYISILYYFPHVVGHSFRKEFEKLPWLSSDSKKYDIYWNAWIEGKTGFPVVDAGMRQLNKTGFCHNRSRMIVATFLTKILHINWQDGEKYFAQNLVDYNISSNNGGWQWSSSTGTDSQPYFRIFNYESQLEKFDPKCEYVKTWIPELKDIPVKHILEWEIYHKEYEGKIDYPGPIVNYKDERLKCLDMFKTTIEKIKKKK